MAGTAGSGDEVQTGAARRRSLSAPPAGLRSRAGPPGRAGVQQGVLLGVVAGLVAFAALLPLMTGVDRAHHGRQPVRDLGALGRTVEARTGGGTATAPVSAIAPVLGPEWDGIAGPPVGQYRVQAAGTIPGSMQTITLLGREGFCDHVRLSAGRCATSRFEVMISGASARASRLTVRDSTVVIQMSGATEPVRRTLRVVGVFEPRAGDDFWRGIDVGAVSVKRDVAGEPVQLHTWLTPAATFSGTVPQVRGRSEGLPPPLDRDSPASVGWAEIETSVARQLTPAAFTYDKLDQARAAVARSQALAAQSSTPVDITEQVTTIDQAVRGDVEQVQVIAPLLLAQLVLLQVVLVWVVLRALLTQRRMEVALVRLRSPGARGARRLVLGELLPPVLIGLPVGLLLAYALQTVSRLTWLPGPAVWSWTALLVAVAATAVCVLLLLLLVRGVVRTPISALLRTVPPRQRRWSLSAVETVLLTLAAGMLVAVTTGNLTGAPVLVTPLVIALAVGLLVGGLLVPLGNRVAGRLLDRGRLPSLLALTGLARRPSTRQLILALTAAGALLAFGASTLVLGQANRAAATSAQTGAPVRLLAIDASATVDPQNLVRVVDQVDRRRQHLAPVFRVRSGSSDGPVALLGEPGPMTRIASKVNGIDPWGALGDASAGDGSAGGAGLPAVVASWSAPATEGGFTAPGLRQADTEYVVAAQVPLVPGGEANTFVTPLAPQLRTADRRDLSAEIWSDGGDPALEQRARSALVSAGYTSVTVERASTTQRRLDESASAYGLQLGLVVAAGSVVVAVLVLVAVLSSQAAVAAATVPRWSGAGVSRGVLGRAGRLETARDRRAVAAGRRGRVAGRAAGGAEHPVVHPAAALSRRGRGAAGAAGPARGRRGTRGGRGRPPSSRGAGRSRHETRGLSVQVSRLVHIYRSDGHDVAALSGVDLVVAAGSTLALLGPSGAGKSTLLSLIAGMDRPTAGTITVGEQRTDQLTDLQLDALRGDQVSLVLQGGARNLVPYLTIRENLDLARWGVAARRPRPAGPRRPMGLGQRRWPGTPSSCDPRRPSSRPCASARRAVRGCCWPTNPPHRWARTVPGG